MTSSPMKTKAIIYRFGEIPNYYLKDPELTWGAKGLYAYLVKFPEHFCLLDILRLSKDTQSATQAYLKELEEAGYLISDNKIK